MFTIMVVEDDHNTRRLMCTVLERYGYNPIMAIDGEDALRQLDVKHVDLIVLDLMMPRMDGYEFTRTLREGGCNIPILMVTAKQAPADKRKGFIVGTDDYMTKPVDEEEMLRRYNHISAYFMPIAKNEIRFNPLLEQNKSCKSSDNSEIEQN